MQEELKENEIGRAMTAIEIYTSKGSIMRAYKEIDKFCIWYIGDEYSKVYLQYSKEDALNIAHKIIEVFREADYAKK